MDHQGVLQGNLRKFYVIKITIEVMNANMTISIRMEMRFKDYGNTTIDLPEDAKNVEVEEGFDLSQLNAF